jgi:hypothetical protein
MERDLSSVVNHETAGKDRKRLVHLIALAIRELNAHQDITSETRDLAAFIALSLIAIHNTIDRSVEPWEKRGYWIKADRYRTEWDWTLKLGNKMRESILNEDWAMVAISTVAIYEKLGDVKLPVRNKSGKFWGGSFNMLAKK